ncbi:carbohydrate binding domain-containing protein [[Kitasatospora] papulosa]|uniref:carbohydrate binding domain-containing protein n=1 Tax=[Kitasatospora] papulosa TaxID=1464011 RepID=UPI0037A3A01B
MAFPETPLGLRVGLLLGGTWRDVTKDTYRREPIRIKHGTSAEGAQPDPASCSLLLNNAGGRYSPRNVTGPYFGMLGRNTPIRVTVPGDESYLSLPGDPSAYAGTPDTAALRITGDIDIRAEATADWYATPTRSLIGRWDGATGQRSYMLAVEQGTVCLFWSVAGTAGQYIRQPLPAMPARAALRATLDVDTGAGGHTVRFYWAPSLDGPWTELPSYTGTGTTSIHAGTAPLRVGPSALTSVPPIPPVQGRVHRAEVRNGIGGTVVAAPNFAGRAEGTASLTDTAGRAWTLTGAAEITAREPIFSGEVSEWPPRWSASEQSAWVPVQAAGILRRLGQGRRPLQSTLRRRIPAAAGLLAYWPMEDGATASQLYSPTPGARPLAVSGMSLASDATLPGSAPLPTLGAAATLSGVVPATTAAGWHVEAAYRLPTLPGVQTEIVRLTVTGMGAITTVHVFMGAAGIRIEARDADSAQIVGITNTTPAAITAAAGPWNSLAVFSSPSPSGTALNLAWRDVITGAWWYAFTSAAVPLGRVTGVTGVWGSGTQGMSLGHVAAFAVPGTAPQTAGVTIYEGADRGYLRETATARLTRLAAEEPTLSLTVVPGDTTTPSEQMGPQGQDVLLDLLAECVATDGGVMYERMDRPGLIYRDRATLYNQAPALTLDYAAGHVAPPMEPTDDDADTVNDVTVTREGGSSGRYVVEEGPNSTRPPEQGGVGSYEQAVTLSLADDAQTAPLAAWLAHLGTWDEARYPSVRVHLHRHPELIPAVRRLRPGDMLRIVNPPHYTGPGPLDLLIRQIEHEPRPRAWDVTFVCTPAGPYRVGVADDPTLGRADTDGSQLAAAATDTDTTLSVATTKGRPWITFAANTVPDPSFEQGTGTWACTRGAAIAAVSHERTLVHSGTGALRITRVHPTDTGTMNLGTASAEPAAAGQTWTASAWVYSNGAAANAMRAALVWKNAAGTDTYIYGTAPSVTRGYWQQVTATAVLPAGAVSVRLSIEGRSAWTVGEWWQADDVRLARTDSITGPDQDEGEFSIAVAGERMTVHSISGTTSPQTFTVTRATNGIRKAHPSAADVRLADPTTVAL